VGVEIRGEAIASWTSQPSWRVARFILSWYGWAGHHKRRVMRSIGISIKSVI